jgi:RNA polymerase sigma-70 factor (ECF subfamily)
MTVGDVREFREVYDAHAGAVYGVARQVTRNRVAAEEVVQDTFLTLWRLPERFDPARGTMRSFLCTIAHRRSIDWLRSRAGRPWSSLVAVFEEADAIRVDEIVCRDDTERAVRRAVASLPAPLRSPLELAYFGGLTYRQVGVNLDLPEGTVKSRIRAGLRQLAATLADLGSRERDVVS